MDDERALQFHTVATEFRLIRDIQIPIVVPYHNDSENYKSVLDSVEQQPNFENLRQLQRFIVRVFEKDFEKLRGRCTCRS